MYVTLWVRYLTSVNNENPDNTINTFSFLLSTETSVIVQPVQTRLPRSSRDFFLVTCFSPFPLWLIGLYYTRTI
jgi:hypothetical protein